MIILYRTLKAMLLMILLSAPTLAFSQEQPINKSVTIENGAKNINELPMSSPIANQMSSEIESARKENDWLSKLFTDPIALFTFLLFLATCALWWATRLLVIGAEQTAQRQLRAYVSMMHDEKMFFSDNGSLVAPVITKNHGNTPAHNLMSCLYIDLHKWPLEIKLDPPHFAEDASRSPLAPGEQIRQYVELSGKLNQQQIEAIAQQSGAIVVWGEVRYTDVFGKQRKTSLCLYSTGNDFDRGELAYHSHGNDSN